MKKSIESCIVDAVKDNGGSASLQQIYVIVSDQIKDGNVVSSDYKHTVRGLLSRMIREGKIIRDNKTQFYKFPSTES